MSKGKKNKGNHNKSLSIAVKTEQLKPKTLIPNKKVKNIMRNLHKNGMVETKSLSVKNTIENKNVSFNKEPLKAMTVMQKRIGIEKKPAAKGPEKVINIKQEKISAQKKSDEHKGTVENKKVPDAKGPQKVINIVQKKFSVLKKSDKNVAASKGPENVVTILQNKNSMAMKSGELLKTKDKKSYKPNVNGDSDDDSDMDDVDLNDSEDGSDLELDSDSDMENVIDSLDSDNEEIVKEDSDNSSVELTIAEASKKINSVSAMKDVKNAGIKKEIEKVEKVNKNDLTTKKCEASKDVKKVEVAKDVKKAEAVTSTKKLDAVTSQKKIETTKEVKKAETAAPVQKVIDPSTESGKILIEMNKRRHMLSECLIHVKNISKNATSSEISSKLENVVSIDLPSNSKSRSKHRGYGFIRFANANDAAKAMVIVNGTTLHEKLMVANKFFSKKVVDDISHVNFSKIILTSFKFKDISESVRSHFSTGVTVKKTNIVTYELTFENKYDAMNLFKKEKVTVDGQQLLASLVYNDRETYDNAVLPIANEPTKLTAAPKRGKSGESNEVVAKKSKVALPQRHQIKATEKGSQQSVTSAPENQIKKKKRKNKKKHNAK